MTVRHGHWIGGKAQAPSSGTYLPTSDPRTGQPGDMIAAGSPVDTLHEYAQTKTISLSLL